MNTKTTTLIIGILVLSIIACSPWPYVVNIKSQYDLAEFPLISHNNKVDIFLQDEPWPERPYVKIKMYQFVIRPRADLTTVINDLEKQAAKDGLDALSFHGNTYNPDDRSNSTIRVTGLKYLDNLDPLYNEIFRYDVYEVDSSQQRQLVCRNSKNKLSDDSIENCRKNYIVNKAFDLNHHELLHIDDNWKQIQLSDSTAKREKKFAGSKSRTVLIEYGERNLPSEYKVTDIIFDNRVIHTITAEYDDNNRLRRRQLISERDGNTYLETIKYIGDSNKVKEIIFEQSKVNKSFVIIPIYFDDNIIAELINQFKLK